MSKLLLLFAVLVCVFGVVLGEHDDVNGNKYRPSKLMLTLDQVLEDMIDDGTYERILNSAVGAGNWVYPDDDMCPSRRGYKLPFPDEDDNSLYNVLTSGALKVASRENGIFAQASGSTSARIGSGVEFQIVTEFARRLSSHYNVVVEPYIFNVPEIDNIWEGLGDSSFDIVVAGLSLTEARRKHWEFSCEYFHDTVTFLRTGRESELLLDGLNDCNSPDVTIGVLSGSAAEVFVENHLPEANLWSFSNSKDFAAASVFGAVHVAIADAWEIQAVLDSGFCSQCHRVSHNLGHASYRVWGRQVERSSAVSLAVSALTVVAMAVLYVFI